MILNHVLVDTLLVPKIFPLPKFIYMHSLHSINNTTIGPGLGLKVVRAFTNPKIQNPKFCIWWRGGGEAGDQLPTFDS